MRPRKPRRWPWIALMVAGFLGVPGGAGQAAEEARRFLEGLRQLGYYDTALEYLDQARANPMVDQQFKDTIDYEAGVTLIADSQSTRVATLREQQLDEARQRFNKFLAEHPQHALTTSAKTQLANLLAERGKIFIEQADRPNTPTAEAKGLREQARGLYEESQKVLTELEKQLIEELKKYPKIIDPKETKQIEARDQIRRDLVQARLALAQVAEEIARTYPPDSDERKQRLAAAAKTYYELYDKYSTRLGGLYARLWEGRCYKELGQTDKAFEAFDELLTGPDDPQPFRLLKNKAAILALETSLLPGSQQLKRADAIYREWEKTARATDEASIEGLAIKYLAAEAYLEHARSLKSEKGKDAAESRKESLREARRLLGDVADRPGEYQVQAKAKLRSPELAGEEVEIPEPTSFAEAVARAGEALGQMQSPDVKPERMAELREEAIKYYRMAMAMRTPQTTLDEINVVRYYLAYLYYVADDFYRAAVAGEFLARRYPSGPGARQGAKIAMAAYARLMAEAGPEEDDQFESQRMANIARYITEVWQGEPEADEAWMMLIRAAVVNGQLDRALERLTKISPDSPRRGEAELMTGQALWGAYLKASQLPDSQRPAQPELDKMVSQAQKTLEDGINRMRESVESGERISYTLAASVLSLAQISIDAGQADVAVKWLEDPKIGILTLVEKGHPATQRSNVRLEAYKAALRAYVAVQQLDRAEEVMQSLEKMQGGDEEGGEKLTRIYISLGRQLEEMLKRLRSEGKDEQAGKVSDGFELFLTRILERKQGNTFNSLNWVAQTFFSLGAGFDPGGKTLPDEARDYYQKAADAYRRILELCGTEGFDAPPGAATSIQIRLARCLRRLGDCKGAMDILVDVLKVRNTMIDAQIEAAYTYQSWGEQDARYYPFAIKGGRRATKKDGTKTNLVWGWGKLSKLLARSEKHRSMFHEARYNLALCRFKMAQSKTKTEKHQLLKQAQDDILIVQRLYPEMGGQEWYGKYDQLLKTIQQLRNLTPSGLKGSAARIN